MDFVALHQDVWSPYADRPGPRYMDAWARRLSPERALVIVVAIFRPVRVAKRLNSEVILDKKRLRECCVPFRS